MRTKRFKNTFTRFLLTFSLAAMLLSSLAPLFKLAAQATQVIHNIEVCFIAQDLNGNILPGLPADTVASINLYSEGVNLLEGQVNSYGLNPRQITYTSALGVNRDVLGGDGVADAYCSTQQYTDPTNMQYAYDQASVSSPYSWQNRKYNDQFNINVQSTADLLPYSGQFFDDVVGNEAERNINADGHIVLSNTTVYRHLIIGLRLAEALPTPEAPVISVGLQNGAAFTGSSEVNVGLQIAGSANAAFIRFGGSEPEVNAASWINYQNFNGNFLLPNSSTTGNKTLCAQVLDGSNQTSNIACDEIILDNLAPTGSVQIAGGVQQLSNLNTTLDLSAQDPALADSSPGAGGISYRLSADGSTWAAWSPFAASVAYTLVANGTSASVFVQYQDAAGNISDTYSDTVDINPYAAAGSIKIENDAVFSDVAQVNASLSFTGTQPEFMRFTQTLNGAAAAPPPVVFQPTDNLGGWTYWEAYAADKQWDLANPQAGVNNSAFGVKTLWVQYMLPGGSVVSVSGDSIIYASMYKVDYLSVAHSELAVPVPPVPGQAYQPNIPEYTLDNMPTAANTAEQFNLKLKLTNGGSLVWQNAGDHPVQVTYFWEAVDIAPEFADLVAASVRGQSASASSTLSWDQTSGTITLPVTTPSYPGTYKLRIDTVHEGTAFFSDFGNPSPSFDLNIAQNPVQGIPQLPQIEDAPNTGYYPPNPQAGQRWQICGFVRFAPANAFGATYMVVETDGSGAVWYILQAGIGNYLNQQICVPIQFTQTGSYNYIVVGYDSQAVSYPSTIHLVPGQAVTVEFRFQNIGFNSWPLGATRLGRADASLFQDPTDPAWLAPHRISMRNSQAVGMQDVGAFRFNLKAPSGVTPGSSYTECWRPVVEGVSWAGGDERNACITIIIDSDPIDPVTYPPLPPLPTGDTGYVLRYSGLPLLAGPQAGFPALLNLAYGAAVTVVGQITIGNTLWLQVTSNGSTGWVPASSIDYVSNPPGVNFGLTTTYTRQYVCSSTLSTRTGPGDQYPVHVVIPGGATVYVVLVAGDWQMVQEPNYATGWVKVGSLCNALPYATGGSGGGSVAGQSYFQNQIYARPLNEGSYTISQGYLPGHAGTDYAAACGTPIFAIADGVVVGAVGGFTRSTYIAPPAMLPLTGDPNADKVINNINKAKLDAYNTQKNALASQVNQITIRHDNNTESVYLHLTQVLVSAGQTVRKGQKIGTVGMTGWATGCHLHLEVRTIAGNNASRVNPESVFQTAASGELIAATQAIATRQATAVSKSTTDQNGLVHQYCGAWIKDYYYFQDPGQSWQTYTNLIFNPITGQAYRLRGDMRIAYWDKYQGTCGSLGLPTTDDLWAATSPMGTTGAYQKFDNGVIHSSYLGTYATTGKLYQIHSAGVDGKHGTAAYGFPKGEMYRDSVRGMCQQFEMGTLCEITLQNGNIPDPLAGVENETIKVLPDINVFIQLGLSISRDISEIANQIWRPDLIVSLYANYLWGLLKGTVQSFVDIVQIVWDIVFNGALPQLAEAIQKVLSNPEVLLYLLYDKVGTLVNMDIYAKVQAFGEVMGQVLGGILTAYAGGWIAEGAKSLVGGLVGAVDTFISSLSETSWLGLVANSARSIVVGGVEITVWFGNQGLVKVTDLWNAVKGLTSEAFDAVLNTVKSTSTKAAEYLYSQRWLLDWGVSASRGAWKLIYQGADNWISSAGLKYSTDQISHIMLHAVDDLTKDLHGIFTVAKQEILPLIDEAKVSIDLLGMEPSAIEGVRTIYIVDMGRVIGIEGGSVGSRGSLTNLKIVMEGNNVISAFPVRSIL